ncbi:MAG: hypothetical protein A2Z88_07830 [Omnitrophica WOR_2 bacterium GWA2_47_8]|nr:MAG: hypothetical protein A2Z88_07830 [Omnitrophica WOR_2 bacterium GWA2_47_8]
MWFPLALVVAVLTSVQDVLSKNLVKRTNVYVVTWAWWFFTLPVFYIVQIFWKMPVLGPVFWPTLCASTVLLTLAVIYYIKALEATDLSLSVPMLSFTPLFMLFTSRVMLGEVPKPLGFVGILFIVAGSYLLFVKDMHLGFLAPFKSLLRGKGPRYMLIVAVLFSISGNLDKVGVSNSSFVFWNLMLDTTSSVLLTFVMFKKCPQALGEIKKDLKGLVSLGFVNAVCLMVQMSVITMTLVPYLISVKRTSVLFSALYGFFFLKEKGIKERVVGIVLMLLGVFLIGFLRN